MATDPLEHVLDQQNLYKQTLTSKYSRETSNQPSGGLTAPSGWCRLVWRRRRMEVRMKQRPGGSDPFINHSPDKTFFSLRPTCRPADKGGGRWEEEEEACLHCPAGGEVGLQERRDLLQHQSTKTCRELKEEMPGCLSVHRSPPLSQKTDSDSSPSLQNVVSDSQWNALVEKFWICCSQNVASVRLGQAAHQRLQKIINLEQKLEAFWLQL